MVLEGVDAEYLAKLPLDFFKSMTRSQMKDLMRSYVGAFRDKRIGDLTTYKEVLASAFSSADMRKYVNVDDINMIGYDPFIPIRDLEAELLQALINRWSKDHALTSIVENELKQVSLEDIEENADFNSLNFPKIFFKKVAMVNPPANWPSEFFRKAESLGVNLSALQLDGGVQMDINSSAIQSFRAVEGQRNKVVTDLELEEEENVNSVKKNIDSSRIKSKTRSKSNQTRASTRNLSTSARKSSQAKLIPILRKQSQLNMQKEIKRDAKKTIHRRNTANEEKRRVRAKGSSDSSSDNDSDDADSSDSTETTSDDSVDEKKKKRKKSSKNRKGNSSKSKKDKKKKGHSRRKKDSDSDSSDGDLKELRRKLKKKSSRKKKERKSRSIRRKHRTGTRNDRTNLGNSFHNVLIVD